MLSGFQMVRLLMQIPQILQSGPSAQDTTDSPTPGETAPIPDGEVQPDPIKKRKRKKVGRAEPVERSDVVLSLAEEIMQMCDRVCVNRELSCNELSCFLQGTAHEGFARWMLDEKRIRYGVSH